MDKFAALREAGTSAPNFGLDTAAVIERLKIWDALYGIEIGDVGHDRVNVKFVHLPDNLMALANEVYEFCPDTVDQGLGVIDEETAAILSSGDDEKARRFRALFSGVNFSDPHYGIELLKRWIENTKAIGLWWD